MFILRIASAALAVVLIVIIAQDMSAQRAQQAAVLEYKPGIYLGQTDTAISEETRILIRQRSLQTSAW